MRHGPNITKLPLLPYERTLLASVGMSEEEYEQYLRWVGQKQNQFKGDEIVAGPALVPTLISLAVGVLFTVVGALLAPKPKPLSQDDRSIRSKKGDDATGRSRFSPTFGFDSQTELATYGTPIPIHFGNDKEEERREKTQSNWPVTLEALLCNECTRYVPSANESGGMVISPLLVWSRMYSMGKGHIFQGMYVVGEKMANDRKFDPDLAGIWLGNNTLDKVSDKNFAFYYDNEGKQGRIRHTDLREGTDGGKATGNPFLADKIDGYRTWKEAFPTPVCDMDESSGFSMTYSLSNQSTFGCYSPIMNGVDRRPPWRVISLPKSSGDDTEDQVKEERKKISGGEDRQEPSGVGYGRMMGLTKLNGKALRGSEDKPRWDEEVQRGDKVTFEISKKRYDEDLFDEGVSVEDLVNESDADRQAADDALQIGEEFMINSSRFRVVDRDDGTYEMEEESTWAELECIEDRDAKSQIGFVSKDYFTEDKLNEDASTSIFQKKHVPPHWSPLLKYEMASFRNIRKADVTEIGIKSRVWAQMNGMCNFPTIPTSNELRDKYDKKDVQYTNGVQNQYFTRFSFFKLYMRDPQDVKDPSSVSTWKDTRVVFAIRGNEPVDQYNYIRIKPKRQKQYEYRLFPLNSGWAAKREQDPDDWGTNDVAWVLDVAKGEDFSLLKTITGIGKVEISSVGHLIGVRCSVTSPLMLGKKSSDNEYDDPDKGWCPDEWCRGFTGKLDIDLDDGDDATNGLGKELEDTCEGDTCFEVEEEEPSRGALQSAFWNRLAAIEEAEEEGEEVPDYIKDGFNVGCVECGASTWDDEDDEPEIAAMLSDVKNCDERYEEKSVGTPGSGNNPDIETGIKHVRTARGPGASSSVRETWKWKGKTIYDNSKNDADNPMKDEVKDGGKIYQVGEDKISDGGSTSGFFTYAIKRCDADDGSGGGGGDGGGDGDGDGGSSLGCSKPHWAIWEYATQVNEGSYYSGLISRSSDNGAEHQIVYVNESKKPREITQYPEIAMMGLSLRATREFNNLDQPRLYLRGGVAVKKLEDFEFSDDFNVRSASALGPEPTAAEAFAAPIPRRQQAQEIRVTMKHEVKCGTKDRRIIKVTAGFMNQRGDKTIDPGYAAAKDTRWMVQWFEGKNRNHSKRVRDPQWYSTTVDKQWTRDPHAWSIKGNVAQIQVPKGSGWYTCYMWPAESNTTNNSEIENESGLDFGPKQNSQLTNSLSMFLFDKDDEIKQVVTNGVAQITAQRTTGTKYEATYTYLWSGKNNYSTKREENGDYVYWYEVDSARQEIEVKSGDLCPGDTQPPGPGDFYAEIVCGDGTTSTNLTCKTKNCAAVDGTVTYLWQYKPVDDDPFFPSEWGPVPAPIIGNERTIGPGFIGYYRCKATCTAPGGTVTKKTDKCFVNDSDFPVPDPPPTEDPDPPEPEDPIDPDPPPAFRAEIECGNGLTGSTLICRTKNCQLNGGTVEYEWQWRLPEPDPLLGPVWETPPGPIFINQREITPGVAGYYRCKATCLDVTKKTQSCFVKSSFEDPDPPPTDDPDPPPPEDPDPPRPPDDDGENIDLDPSNNYADLIYWLLTDKNAGTGNVVKDDMIDKDRMIVTANFLNRMGLTWDGTLSETTNLRSFASATAPFFLCNFTVTNGKFTLWPVIPVGKAGVFKGKKVFIKQLFTEGNIIDGSFSLDYLDADDRRPFKAAMRYRVMSRNQLPEERTLTSKWYTGKFSDPTEEFDMTQFCTTPEHAQLAARYFMWIRNVVTHTVKFQTVPEVMNNVGPGDFIKVQLESATIQRQNIAAVTAESRINSADMWLDGEHDVAYWVAGMDEPGERTITVKDGVVQEPGMEMALMSQVRNGQNDDCEGVATTYQVESVSLEEDGLVEVVASYYPVDDKGVADLYNALFGLGRWSC